MVFCRVAYAQLKFELSHVQNYMQPIGDSPQLFTLSAAVPNFPCNVKCINSEIMYQMSPAFFKTSINFFGKYHLK